MNMYMYLILCDIAEYFKAGCSRQPTKEFDDHAVLCYYHLVDFEIVIKYRNWLQTEDKTETIATSHVELNF